MESRRRSLRIVTVAWLFGAVWFTATSSPLLTTYARALGCTGFEFGLINALPFLAALLSLPASVVIDATGQRRAIFLTGLYGQRLLWVLIAVVPLWLFPGTATAEELRLVTPPLVALFLLLYFLQQTGQAVGGPAWVGWMADLVPEPIRGRYFARRRQLGVLPAVVATLLIGWAVDHFTTGITLGPDTPAAERRHVIFWCSMLFIAVSIPGIIDIALFHWVPHTRRPMRERGRAGRGGRGVLSGECDGVGGWTAGCDFGDECCGRVAECAGVAGGNADGRGDGVRARAGGAGGGAVCRWCPVGQGQAGRCE